MFVMTQNEGEHNHNAEHLGDRTLAGYVGSGNEGILAFSTYTYTDLAGNGNPNAHQAVPYTN